MEAVQSEEQTCLWRTPLFKVPWIGPPCLSRWRLTSVHCSRINVWHSIRTCRRRLTPIDPLQGCSTPYATCMYFSLFSPPVRAVFDFAKPITTKWFTFQQCFKLPAFNLWFLHSLHHDSTIVRPRYIFSCSQHGIYFSLLRIDLVPRKKQKKKKQQRNMNSTCYWGVICVAVSCTRFDRDWNLKRHSCHYFSGRIQFN